MPNSARAGIALLLTLLASLAFFVGATLGLNFYFEGRLWLTAIVVVPVAVVYVIATKHMILGKGMRNSRVGDAHRIPASIAVVAILAVGSIFFSKFLSIYDRREQLSAVVDRTIGSVAHTDSTYRVYVDRRLADVKAHAPAKDRNYCVTLLRERLLPSNIDSLAHARGEWLASLNEAHVWNIYTAANVRHLSEASQRWNEEYATISSVILDCEADSVRPFVYPESEQRLADFTRDFTELHRPDGRSIALLCLCLFCILISYFATRTQSTGRE